MDTSKINKIGLENTLTSSFTKNVENQYLSLIKSHIQAKKVKDIIKNSFNLIKRKKYAPPREYNLNKNIDPFTYFTILSFILKNKKNSQNLSKKAHHIAMTYYNKEAIKYQDIKYLCRSKNDLFSKRLTKLEKKLKSKCNQEIWQSEKWKKLARSVWNKMFEEIDNEVFKNCNKKIRGVYDPNLFLEQAIMIFEPCKSYINKSLELCLKANKIRPNSIYIYSVIASLIEEFSNYNFNEHYQIPEYVLTGRDYIFKNLIKEFSFSSNLSLIKQKEILITDPKNLSKSKIKKRIDLIKKIKKEFKNASNLFYNKIAKEAYDLDIFEKKQLGINKNEIYEINNPFLNEMLIIKKFKKNSNLKLEKEIIEFYKTKRNLDLVDIVNFEIKKDEGYLFLKREKGLNLLEYLNVIDKVEKIIDDSNDYKTALNDISKVLNQYPYNFGHFKFLFRKPQFLTEFCKIKKIPNKNRNYKYSLILYLYDSMAFFFESCLKELANLNSNIPNHLIKKELNKGDYKKEISNVLQNIEKNLNQSLSKKFKKRFLKNYDSIDLVLSSSQKSLYKDCYLKNWIVMDQNRTATKVTPIDFERCTIAPVQLDLAFLLDFGNSLKKENINKEYRERLIDYYIDKYNEINSAKGNPNPILELGKKEFKRIFQLKLGEAIKENSINSSKLAFKIYTKKMEYQFERTVEDFIKEKGKRSIEDYIKDIVENINNENPKAALDWDELGRKEFKRIFDYACVHRNLLTFRSYNRFIEKGDCNKETESYKKMSLKNSVKALQKLVSYEKENINELKSLYKDLKGIYNQIYK